MTKFKDFDRSEYIKDPKQASEYLEIMLKENGTEGFYQALGDIAKAKGMSDISKKVGVGRESLYKSLSKKGNPNFNTIIQTLKSLNIDINFKATV